MTTKRSLLARALMVALAPALASCGGQPFPNADAPPPGVKATLGANTGAAPQARLLSAVQRTTTEKTSRISLSMTFSGVGTDVPAISGSGVIDLARKRLQMTIEESAGAQTASVEMRVIGGDLYIRFAGKWNKVRVGEADPETPNPATYLQYLQAIAPDAHVDGHETLRGVKTTRYRATIDLSRALARAGSASQKSLLQQAVKGLGALKFPTTVWLDDLGRLRKMTMTLDFSADVARASMPAGSLPKIDLTMELYDFGIPVDVKAPVIDASNSAATVAQDRAAKADLRNALTAEKVVYIDNQAYSSTPADLKAIEPALDWGGKLEVVVGDAPGVPGGVVCLSEKSGSGTTFALADVGAGPNAGTYYATRACPSVVTAQSFTSFGANW